MPVKRGLGKGLDALFGGLEEIEEPRGEVSELKISEIEPNPDQPRKNFDSEQLRALAESIKRHGVIQPIVVAPRENGFYRIIAGERRWRASKLAGLRTIPAVVRDYKDLEAYEVMLIENLQREDLNPIEEALGYKSLMERFELTQEEISEKVGKSRSKIANSLRLLSLDEAVIKLIAEGKLSEGHARALAGAPKTEQLRLAERIIKEDLSVRRAEKLVRENKKEEPVKKTSVDPNILDIENRLSYLLGTKVKISQGRGKGRIEIEYYGSEDLERIMEKLSKTGTPK